MGTALGRGGTYGDAELCWHALHAVGPDDEQVFVVADGEYSGASPGGVGGDHLDKRSGGGGIQHGGHLVAEQVPRSEHEGAGEAGSLQLAVADFMWPAAEQLGGQADSVG